MFTNLTKERGFTLIELLVVILIIGVLIAVAAPSFLGQQDKARDSSVKQDLTVVRKTAKAIYVNADASYPTTLGIANDSDKSTIIGGMKASEPQLNFVPVPSPATTTNISVSRSSSDSITACKQSTSTIFFCLQTDEAGDATVLASSGGGGLFGVEEAHAATSDVIYSTGQTEAAARAALSGTGGLAETTGGTGGAGWSKTVKKAASAPAEAPASASATTIARMHAIKDAITASSHDGTDFEYSGSVPTFFTSVPALFPTLDIRTPFPGDIAFADAASPTEFVIASDGPSNATVIGRDADGVVYVAYSTNGGNTYIYGKGSNFIDAAYAMLGFPGGPGPGFGPSGTGSVGW